ncbi:MAG: hypothetical protein EOP17_19520 [Rhizobiaceae bacterium]|nr:MAG: hypothetical protein EOP17_19520 [Rhizobiaceae bacterium]
MKKTFILAAAVAALSTSAFAQSAPTSSSVNFKMTADFASLRPTKDKKKAIDVIEIEFSDSKIANVLKLECQPGETTMFVKRRDRACKITGDGFLIDPKGGRHLRVKYQGGLITDAEGFTDARNIKVSYLALNKAPASSGEFTGSLTLKPENTPKDAQAFVDKLVKKVATNGGQDLIDTRIDTITYNRFGTPSQGLNTDRGCIWSDNMGYAYQSELWSIELKAVCADKDGKPQEFKLTGNMPYSAESGPNGEAQYKLTLTPPSATASTDDALFATNNDDDLFAAADGISATIDMVEEQVIKTQVDGKETENASHIEATATFTGTNIPDTLLRSYVMAFSVNAVAVFGP